MCVYGHYAYWLSRPKLWEIFTELFCLEHGACLFGPEALGAFYLTKTVTNGTKISLKSFHKFRKLLNFRNANHSLEPKNSVNSRSKVEWYWKLPDPREVVLFDWKLALENVVPPATGSCRKFRPDVWRLVVKVANEWSKFVVKTFSTIDSISTTDRGTKL